jgi:transposase
MLAAKRRARYGYGLVLHVLLLCAAGHNPTEIAAFLFCSRSSVSRIVRAYRTGTLGFRHGDQGNLLPPLRTTVLMPWLKRALLALLKARPQRYGWCRTRWSCATLAETLKLKHGLDVSAETMRRWLHELGGVWRRAHLVAKDDDPRRIERLGLIRFHHDHLGQRERLVFADELDIHLLPLEKHPQFALLWLPTYCPKANPIERAFGNVHDKCTRNHQRKRLRDLLRDVEYHLQANGPWGDCGGGGGSGVSSGGGGGVRRRDRKRSIQGSRGVLGDGHSRLLVR